MRKTAQIFENKSSGMLQKLYNSAVRVVSQVLKAFEDF